MTYRVTLEPSGHTFDVAPGQRVLGSGLAAGINMPFSCRVGICGTCKGRIIRGSVDYGDAHPAYLTEEEKARGLALLCQAKPYSDLVIAVTELPQLAIPKVLPALVKESVFPASDVAIVKLRLPLNQPVRFAAGQYLDVLLKNDERRSYSIANTPTMDGVIDIELHIRHTPGGAFTDYVFGKMRPRDKWQLELPVGTFFLRNSDKPAVFVASGTGYGPIRSMIKDALARGVTRQMALYWGARTRSDLYMMTEPETWVRDYPNFIFIPVLSEPLVEDAWTGRTGFVHLAVMADFKSLAKAQVYACGAPVMVDAARRDFVATRGLPESEFFADAFVTKREVAAQSRHPVATNPLASGPDGTVARAAQ